MAAIENALSWFTPLPPARNGIADYAGMLLREVARLTPCICYCEDALAEAPAGVEVRDPLQACRHLSTQSLILHQIGNNSGHIFALDALRKFGGVTSLHDLSLLYVNELGMTNAADIYGRMQSPARALGATYARHWKQAGLKSSANYVLFDMVGEVLEHSRRVIVHSDYARNKLVAVHGGAMADKIVVIPHFAKKPTTATCRQARRQLGIATNETLLVTSGFATQAKRFGWLLDALEQLRQRGQRFRWVHAGEERPLEYPLTAAIADHGLTDCSMVTGYLSDEQLDCYLAAADVIINLRFPSVGESSGTLARAFSAGRCCIVTDTGAYAEIPRDVVVHVPAFDAVGALVRTLSALLGDRSLRDAFGARARLYARKFLEIETVAQKYVDTIVSAYSDLSPSSAPRLQRRSSNSQPTSLRFDIENGLPDLSDLLQPASNDFELTLWFPSAEHFAAVAMGPLKSLSAWVGPHVEIAHVKFIAPKGDGSGRIGLCVAGRAGG